MNGIDVDLVYRTARELVGDLAARRVSARELLEVHVRREEALRSELNIVVDRDLRRARRTAAAIDDARLAGEPLARLAGLPMTIKDGLDVEGMPAVVGNPAWVGRTKGCGDADVVATARRAGAVIWGKSNVSYLLRDWQSSNDVYGTTNNPYDVRLTAGGSSGGSAAALAAGVTPLEIGSDVGGSLRVPANFCGVSALKPTWNLLSPVGHIPPDPGTRADRVRDLNVVGPMARGSGDLRMLQAVLVDRPEATRRDVAGRTVGVWAAQPGFPLSSECRAAVERAALALEERGARVVPLALDIPIAEMFDAYWQILISLDADFSSPELAAARRARDEFKVRLANAFDDGLDVILAPVSAVPAFPHDVDTPFDERVVECDGRPVKYETAFLSWISLATSLHVPSLAVPVGTTAAGNPSGVQVIGRWFAEDLLFDVGEALDEVYGFRPP